MIPGVVATELRAFNLKAPYRSHGCAENSSNYNTGRLVQIATLQGPEFLTSCHVLQGIEVSHADRADIAHRYSRLAAVEQAIAIVSGVSVHTVREVQYTFSLITVWQLHQCWG